MKQFLFLLFLVNINCISAQNYFYAGAKVGIHSTNLNPKKFGEKTYARIGVITGISAEYLINYRIGFCVDILYKQVGFGTNSNYDPTITVASNQKVTSILNYDYLSIPIKIRSCPFPKIKGNRLLPFLFDFGIDYSTILKNQLITTLFNENNEQLQKSTSNDLLLPKKKYVSGLVGLTVRYPFNSTTKWNFNVSTNYKFCFKNLATSSFFPDKTIKYNELSLFIGIDYQF